MALHSGRSATTKRILDMVGAITGLAILWPLFIILAVLVRLSSPGPVIFRHLRVGQHGRLFEVLKFRTMHATGEQAGPQVTIAGDPRLTPLGRKLRNLKLDELPQLWNVLRGEMSLVGPRPDVPGYADKLTGSLARVLQLRPGITGPASLFLRDEEALLGTIADPLAYYDEVLFPLKVRIDLAYLEEWTLRKDIAYIIVTIAPFADRWLHVIPRPDVDGAAPWGSMTSSSGPRPRA
jgi:lipopolysaccharide/colanic/teichoic acid biosynthesis glycosyltransferase